MAGFTRPTGPSAAIRDMWPLSGKTLDNEVLWDQLMPEPFWGQTVVPSGTAQSAPLISPVGYQEQGASMCRYINCWEKAAG